MKRPDLVNLFYSIYLIVIALFGFIARFTLEGDFQFTALIPAVFGLILLPMTKPIRNDNRTVAHIAVTLSLLIAVMMTVMLVRNLSGESGFDRRTFIFGLTALVSFGVTLIYVLRFISIKKEKSKNSLN